MADTSFDIIIIGGAIMGADPRSSVTDRWCRTWDVDNLYITDGATTWGITITATPQGSFAINAIDVARGTTLAAQMVGSLGMAGSLVSYEAVQTGGADDKSGIAVMLELMSALAASGFAANKPLELLFPT